MIEQRDELPEWTDEEQQLLASARLDRPPGKSLPRTLHAATAAALASTAASSAAALGAGSKAGALLGLAKPLGVVKWLAVLTLAGGAAVGVQVWRTNRTGGHELAAPFTTSTPARSDASAGTTATPAPPVAAAPTEPTEPPAPATHAMPEASAAPAPRNPNARPGVARAEPSAAMQPDLTREIATLDEARRALRSGRPRDALTALRRRGRPHRRAPHRSRSATHRGDSPER